MFNARTASCRGDRCKWSAYEHEGELLIFVMWGPDGLHVMKVDGPFPVDQDLESLEVIQLVGYKSLDNRYPTTRKEKCTAVFEKVGIVFHL